MTRAHTEDLRQPEDLRLAQAARREAHWKRWGPYLAERQWGTVREDYSPDGDAWRYTTHETAPLRAYRWGEDGIGGISDNHQRLCFAMTLWNGKDPLLKERLFGLTGPEGNHGEDVKELYWYLDSSPTHSYMDFLYKYPLDAFPYQQLREENGKRSRAEPEFELQDTGVFQRGEYADVRIQYAKGGVDDVLIRITITNRSAHEALVHALPTLWFRNTWSWTEGDPDQPIGARPLLQAAQRLGGACHVGPLPDAQGERNAILATHPSLGRRWLHLQGAAPLLFTENESNGEKLGWWDKCEPPAYYKDAFHDALIGGNWDAVHPDQAGTKAAAWYQLALPAGASRVLHLRLSTEAFEQDGDPFGADFDRIFADRLAETDAFYAARQPPDISAEAARVMRQAFAGLLWTKQYYAYDVQTWLRGDPSQPAPPAERLTGRNAAWPNVYNDDILSMPDKWEYPWFAAWDTAFHCVALAPIDADYAKRQLRLLLREWYMHPNGQIPAYEWNFGDVNPPVHAWAAWRVYKIDQRASGVADITFLEKIFHKLLINFTWWVNRKDEAGNNVFEGGFMGLDNIGVFDRSATLPTGGRIEQSDATSWMAMYCLNMLAIAMELAVHNQAYEDVASKFFEHFMYIAHAMHTTQLWDVDDGFFYDVLALPDGRREPMRVRSMVGLIPLFAIETLSEDQLECLPRFRKRLQWFIANRPDLHATVAKMSELNPERRRLLSVVNEDQLKRILRVMLDETEFLSDYGVRSLSRSHAEDPYVLHCAGVRHEVRYEPAESQSAMFGGNSNWRGPIWFPVNFLLIESLQRFGYYYGDTLLIEFPTGSGEQATLTEIAAALSKRLERLFLPGADGKRPCNGGCAHFDDDPHFRDMVLFHEYFHGDTGAGLGASHQTGWTALVAKLLRQTPY